MKRLAEWGGNIVLVLAVLFAIFVLLLPGIFSSRLAIVYSGSMEPAMPMGSLVVSSQVEPTSIKVGDIIAFNPPRNPGVTVSHRVIEVIDSELLSFQTKGDANNAPDPYTVPAESVVSRVTWHMPNVGFYLDKVRQVSRSVWGLGILIGLPAVIIFSSAVRDVNFMYNPRKRRARLQKKRQERLKKRAPASWQLRRAL